MHGSMYVKFTNKFLQLLMVITIRSVSPRFQNLTCLPMGSANFLNKLFQSY